jgi:hypothetical protein
MLINIHTLLGSFDELQQTVFSSHGLTYQNFICHTSTDVISK